MEFHNKQLLDYALFAFERKELWEVKCNDNSITLTFSKRNTINICYYSIEELKQDFRNLYELLQSKNLAKVSFHEKGLRSEGAEISIACYHIPMQHLKDLLIAKGIKEEHIEVWENRPNTNDLLIINITKHIYINFHSRKGTGICEYPYMLIDSADEYYHEPKDDPNFDRLLHFYKAFKD